MRSRRSEPPRGILEAITFEACKAPAKPAPAFRALFGDRKSRKRWIGYWLTDPILGGGSTVLHHALRLLPTTAVSNLGGRLGGVAEKRYRNGPSANRFRQSIARIRPDLAADPARLAATLSAWWRHIGRTYAEYARVEFIPDSGTIEVEGRERLEAALATGRPLIYCSVHLGNFELLLSLLANGTLADGCVGIYEPQPSRFENAIIDRLRRRIGSHALPPGNKSALLLLRHVREGGHVLVYTDEVFEKQVQIPLFGRRPPPAGNVVNAVKLAMSGNGLIVPIHNIRLDDGRFRVVIAEPFEPAPGDGYAARMAATIGRISSHFEPIVTENVEQWFMLQSLRFRPEELDGAPGSR